MAKTKRYYYECLLMTDLGYWGPDQRKERWERRGTSNIQPPHIQHIKRVTPSKGYTARGEPFPPDYIVTDQPLGKQYTEVIKKKVSRPSFDPATGRRNGRYFRTKTSKIKFRLLDADEIDSEIKRHAIDLPWQEVLFETVDSKVELPKDVAILDKSDPEAMGKETTDASNE